MERWKGAAYILLQLSLLTILIYFSPIQVSGEMEEEVKVDRFPVEAVFQLENTKPGDIAYRTITIQNNNDRDILYTIVLENDGDPTLYDELLLRIIHLDEVVFHGKLKDYAGVEDRPLAAQTEEVIEFELKFPEVLGNEFQGLRADFHLEFTARMAAENSIIDEIAKSKNGGTPIRGDVSRNGAGSPLPKTATNMFTYLVIGAILLSIGAITTFVSKRKKQLPD